MLLLVSWLGRYARGWLTRKNMDAIVAKKTAAKDDAKDDDWTKPYTITERDPALATAKVLFVGGGPGSGKGTQCDKLVAKFGFNHISVGDVLRAEVASGSPAGSKLSAIMQEGGIVPAAVTLWLLQNKMKTLGVEKPFLLDGFPRKVDQQVAFEESVCKGIGLLWFECADQVLIDRLLNRAKTSGQYLASYNIHTSKTSDLS